MRFLIALFCVASSFAAQSLDLPSSSGSIASFPNAAPWTNVGSWTLEFRLTNLSPPATGSKPLVSWEAGGGIKGYYASTGVVCLLDFQDAGHDGDNGPCIDVTGHTDILVRYARDTANLQLYGKIWDTATGAVLTGSRITIRDSLGSNSLVGKKFEVAVAPSTICDTCSAWSSGGGTAKIAWIHWSTGVVSFNTTTPPHGWDPPGNLLNYTFEGNGNDNSGNGQNLTMSSATYSTTPSVPPTVLTTTSDAAWGQLTFPCRAGRDCNFVSASYSNNDSQTLIYRWSAAGSGAPSFKNGSTSTPSLVGLTFGQYDVTQTVTDTDGVSNSQTVTVGAVAVDTNDVVVLPSPLDTLVGPQIRYGSNPWPWADDRNKALNDFFGNLQETDAGWNPDLPTGWNYQNAGTVTCTFNTKPCTGSGTTFTTDLPETPGTSTVTVSGTTVTFSSATAPNCGTVRSDPQEGYFVSSGHVYRVSSCSSNTVGTLDASGPDITAQSWSYNQNWMVLWYTNNTGDGGSSVGRYLVRVAGVLSDTSLELRCSIYHCGPAWNVPSWTSVPYSTVTPATQTAWYGAGTNINFYDGAKRYIDFWLRSGITRYQTLGYQLADLWWRRPGWDEGRCYNAVGDDPYGRNCAASLYRANWGIVERAVLLGLAGNSAFWTTYRTFLTNLAHNGIPQNSNIGDPRYQGYDMRDSALDLQYDPTPNSSTAALIASSLSTAWVPYQRAPGSYNCAFGGCDGNIVQTANSDTITVTVTVGSTSVTSSGLFTSGSSGTCGTGSTGEPFQFWTFKSGNGFNDNDQTLYHCTYVDSSHITLSTPYVATPSCTSGSCSRQAFSNANAAGFFTQSFILGVAGSDLAQVYRATGNNSAKQVVIDFANWQVNYGQNNQDVTAVGTVTVSGGTATFSDTSFLGCSAVFTGVPIKVPAGGTTYTIASLSCPTGVITGLADGTYTWSYNPKNVYYTRVSGGCEPDPNATLNCSSQGDGPGAMRFEAGETLAGLIYAYAYSGSSAIKDMADMFLAVNNSNPTFCTLGSTVYGVGCGPGTSPYPYYNSAFNDGGFIEVTKKAKDPNFTFGQGQNAVWPAVRLGGVQPANPLTLYTSGKIPTGADKLVLSVTAPTGETSSASCSGSAGTIVSCSWTGDRRQGNFLLQNIYKTSGDVQISAGSTRIIQVN